MCVAKDFNLTPKQWLFCQEYVANYCNGTKAYMIVYKANYDTARSESSRLLANPNVKACVDKLLEEYKFNKQLIINQVVMGLIETASGLSDEETIIQVGDSIKNVKTKCANRDKNQARDMLLKLFNAYNSTTSQASDEEIEEFKEASKTSVNQVEGFEDEK